MATNTDYQSIDRTQYVQFMGEVGKADENSYLVNIVSNVIPKDRVQSFAMKKNGDFELTLDKKTERNVEIIGGELKGKKATVIFEKTIKGNISQKDHSIKFEHDHIRARFVKEGLINVTVEPSIRELKVSEDGSKLIGKGRLGGSYMGKDYNGEMDSYEALSQLANIKWDS